MSTSPNEDQQLRNHAAVENSDSMTIEFLRARLLTERSISKTARQRADELAKRVTELEEQLKFVTFQRKKAEKATSEVLAILENCGVSDMSEGFESCSDESEAPHERKAHNGSNDIKFKKNEAEAYSSSEVEYAQSTGRSLSWKSYKNSKCSVEKKKYVMDPVVRRRASTASVASNSSSPRRVGKSCRKIRRRDTRLPEELPTDDGLEQVTCHTEHSNCSDGGQYELREITGRENKNSLEQRKLCSNSETPKSSRRLSPNYEDMESALKHQVQLIGQYEAEEKAQNEWETAFRKNNTSSQQDSCDIGNHSDVTEERYDIKSPELLHNDVPINSKQEANEEPVVTRLDKESLSSGHVHVPPRPVPMNMSSQDQNFSNRVTCEPSSSEISFPKSKDTAKQELSGNHNESSNELIVALPNTANDLASVLEELQRAKLSLNHKLNNSTVLTEGTSKPETNMDGFKVPHTPPGLFRLPTDYQYPATTITNHPTNNERSGFAYSPITGGNNFLSVTSANSRTAFSGTNHLDVSAQSSVNSVSPEITSNRNLFRTVPSQPVNVGFGSGLPPQMYFSQPRTNQLDPYVGTAASTENSSYPYFVNMALRLPLNERTSNSETRLPPLTHVSSLSNSETGLPPLTRVSLYDDVGRRHMQM